jgi:YHS domain-containing protein
MSYRLCSLILLLLPIPSVLASDPPALPILCPVSGKPVQKKFSAAYQGGIIYFCDRDCAGKFDPEKADHSTRANLQLAATGQAVQVACPVTGEKIDTKLSLEMNGLKVYFCCIGCLGKVNDEEQEEIRLYYVFGNNAFRSGFAVRKGK